MSLEQYSEDFFKGPAYALVIGISQYEHGKLPGELTGGNDFLHLTCPANDAEDFAGFLRSNGMIDYNVKTLINAEANLSSIKTEIAELDSKCRQSEGEALKPLVVVFFSGHGMVDSRKRHYLLPCDARGDNLAGTALSNRDFWRYLDDVGTNRLVVFLDACHSGTTGDMEAKGTAAYSPLEELGLGEGRYCIASCLPGQYSYEGARNSLFTEKLLQLLSCKEPDAIPDEAIDIFNLYPALRKRVLAAAREKNWEQEPIVSKMDGATGIVLAINKHVREAREKAKQQSDEQRLQFLEMVCNQLEKSGSGRKTIIIRAQLEGYVKVGSKDKLYDNFFILFDAFCENYISHQYVQSNYIDLLVEKHREASDRPTSSNVTRSQSPSKGSDSFVSVPQTTPATVSPPETPRTASAADMESTPAAQLVSVSDKQNERRQFSSDIVDIILAESETILDFYAEVRLLRRSLSQPISRPEFIKQIHAIGQKKTDERSENLLQEIVRLFQEKWPNASVVRPHSVSTLIGQRIR